MLTFLTQYFTFSLILLLQIHLHPYSQNPIPSMFLFSAWIAFIWARRNVAHKFPRRFTSTNGNGSDNGVLLLAVSNFSIAKEGKDMKHKECEGEHTLTRQIESRREKLWETSRLLIYTTRYLIFGSLKMCEKRRCIRN